MFSSLKQYLCAVEHFSVNLVGQNGSKSHLDYPHKTDNYHFIHSNCFMAIIKQI